MDHQVLVSVLHRVAHREEQIEPGLQRKLVLSQYRSMGSPSTYSMAK